MIEDKEAFLRCRPFAYALMARLFKNEPEEGVVALLSEKATIEAILVAAGGDCRAADALTEMAASAEEAGIERLRSEFTRLFLGPARLPVPPWESVFSTGEPLLFQQATAEVRQAYRAHGFEVGGYPKEADDHLAVELEFLARLGEAIICAWESGDAEAARRMACGYGEFLRTHPCSWFGPFAEQLEAYAEKGTVGRFYPQAAALAALLCRYDQEVSAELVSGAA